MFKNKTVLKIFSLVAAICLWAYVMGEVDPETKGKVGDIPVYFTNTDLLAEEGLAVVQEEELTVNVLIKGKRSDVNDTKKAGLVAYVDVSDCEKGKNSKKIEISVPEGISLESVSTETLEFVVDELVEEEKPVEIEFYGNGNKGGSDRTPWIIECVPEKVMVRGAKSSVKKVEVVQGNLSMERVSEEKSRWSTVSLEPVNKRGKAIGGVTLDASEAKVNARLMAIKTVKLEVSAENLEEDITVEKMDVPKKVTLVGPISVMEDLAQIDGIVDLKGMTASGKAEIQLRSPDQVYLYDEGNIPTAEITVKADE